MKYIICYGLFLFVGLPLIMFTVHVSTLPEDAKQELKEVAKDFNGRIYSARIYCPTGRDHVMRVHGRNRDDARLKLESQLKRCNVEILEGESDPLWKEALRSAY